MFGKISFFLKSIITFYDKIKSIYENKKSFYEKIFIYVYKTPCYNLTYLL